jgi:hypothetical protein
MKFKMIVYSCILPFYVKIDTTSFEFTDRDEISQADDGALHHSHLIIIEFYQSLILLI